MLKCIRAYRVDVPQPGEWWRAMIMGDEDLENNYVTGADVEGMSADDRLAPGSCILVPGAVYLAYEPEVFIQK